MSDFKFTLYNYTPEHLSLYKNGEFVIRVSNEDELMQIRIQIAENSLEGYFLRYGSDMLAINKYGVILNYPPELYSRSSDLAAQLLRIGIEKRKEHRYR